MPVLRVVQCSSLQTLLETFEQNIPVISNKDENKSAMINKNKKIIKIVLINSPLCEVRVIFTHYMPLDKFN